MGSWERRDCPECGTANVVARCEGDGRGFVLTMAHLEHRTRQLKDGPLEADWIPAGYRPPAHCDFCVAESDARINAMAALSIRTRQSTCPRCRAEIFSDQGGSDEGRPRRPSNEIS
jgi:hypothetical protein